MRMDVLAATLDPTLPMPVMRMPLHVVRQWYLSTEPQQKAQSNQVTHTHRWRINSYNHYCILGAWTDILDLRRPENIREDAGASIVLMHHSSENHFNVLRWEQTERVESESVLSAACICEHIAELQRPLVPLTSLGLTNDTQHQDRCSEHICKTVRTSSLLTRFTCITDVEVGYWIPNVLGAGEGSISKRVFVTPDAASIGEEWRETCNSETSGKDAVVHRCAGRSLICHSAVERGDSGTKSTHCGREVGDGRIKSGNQCPLILN